MVKKKTGNAWGCVFAFCFICFNVFLSHRRIGRGVFFWLLYCAIAIVRLCAHIIIIYNDIHARAEPAGILQKIRV